MKLWMQAARPKTLPASLCPVVLGSIFCWPLSSVQLQIAALCLAFALLAQIGANFSNDYFDAKKGSDTSNRRGPVRVVAQGLVLPEVMRFWTAAVFCASFLCVSILGLYIGWVAPVLGGLCILLALAYTAGPLPLAYVGLGDVFVILFFGIVPTVFTGYALTGVLSLELMFLGLSLGLISTGILTVNNLRDRLEDKLSNKRTLAVRFGELFAKREYAFCLFAPFAISLSLCTSFGRFAYLFPLVLAPLALKLVREIYTETKAREQNMLLGKTGRFLILFVLMHCIGFSLESLWS
jgi:1,4-dihydroxy-2-naphthoate polyprenyltransferase